MERQGNREAGWSPLRGSYEEAVLSWYEQVEASFRRRALDAQRTGQLPRPRPSESKSLPVMAE